MFVQLPDEGQYGLDIYARDPDFQSEKRTMSHCCKYLLNYKKLNTPTSGTSSTNGSSTNGPGAMSTQQTISSENEAISSLNLKIGPNLELLNALGMQPLSHVEPVIRLDDATTDIDLQFKMSKAVDFSFDLKYSGSPCASSNGGVNNPNVNGTSSYVQLKSTDIVKVKQYGYTICFSLNLPMQKYGNYLFTVYASDDQNRTKNLPAVYTYLIKLEKKSASYSFSNFNGNSNSPRLQK